MRLMHSALTMQYPDVVADTVLVVEDDSLFATAVSDNLELAGYGIAGPVDNAVDAFAACEEAQPAAALVDIDLAGSLDGLLLGAELAARGVAVIYLTAHFDRALAEGRGHAAALLAKPCSYDELIDALARALG
jgi:DNA-binding NtrC family response regulator